MKKLIFCLGASFFSLAAYSTDWKTVLRAPGSAKVQIPLNQCSIQTPFNQDLCDQPVEQICSTIGNGHEYETLKKQIRDSVSKSEAGDKLDRQYQRILIARKGREKFPETASKNQSSFHYVSPTESRKNSTELEKVERAIFIEQSKQLAMVAELENKILTQFGKTPADLIVLIETIKGHLINHVLHAKEFERSSNAESIIPTADDVAAKLNSVKFQSTQDLAQIPLPSDFSRLRQVNENSALYFDVCGTDGLGLNSNYDGTELKLCPGLLLQMLSSSQGNLTTLAAALGHEISHSINSGIDILTAERLQALSKQFPSATKDRANTDDIYKRFLSCVDRNFISDKSQKFGKYSSAIHQLKDLGIPNLEKEIERLQAMVAPDRDKMGVIKRKISAAEALLEQYQQNVKFMKNRNPDNIVNAEAAELEADFESSFAVSGELSKVSPEKRRAQMIDTFSFYCPTPESDEITKLLWGDEEDPQHPPDRFRIENYFRSPEIRALLGCAPLSSGDRAWCDLSGARR